MPDRMRLTRARLRSAAKTIGIISVDVELFEIAHIGACRGLPVIGKPGLAVDAKAARLVVGFLRPSVDRRRGILDKLDGGRSGDTEHGLGA